MPSTTTLARDAGQLDLFQIGTLSPHQRLTVIDKAPPLDEADFGRLYGNEIAKRALEIALVARHTILLVGPVAVGMPLLRAAEDIGWMSGAALASMAEGHPNGVAPCSDMAVEVREPRDCDRFEPQERSAEIAARVKAAKARREAIPPAQLDEPAKRLLVDASVAMRLDEASVKRVLSVARSIAALAGAERIGRIHIAEALSYTPQPPAAPEPALPPTPEAILEPEPEPVKDRAGSVGDDIMADWHKREAELWEVVAVDAKRFEHDGDIDAAYSADTLAFDGKVRKPFKFRGGEWVNTGGCWSRGGGRAWVDCYHVVPLDAFSGPSAPYRDHDWDEKRGDRQFGSYHGMSAKHGARDVVLQGPKVIFVNGAPDQAALL